MTALGKLSPVRKTVVPQPGQKCEVIFLPLSAVLENVLGVPAFVVSVARPTLIRSRMMGKDGMDRHTGLKLEVALGNNDVIAIGGPGYLPVVLAMT